MLEMEQLEMVPHEAIVQSESFAKHLGHVRVLTLLIQTSTIVYLIITIEISKVIPF